MKLYKQINKLKIYNLTTGGWVIKKEDKIIASFAMRSETEKFCIEYIKK